MLRVAATHIDERIWHLRVENTREVREVAKNVGSEAMVLYRESTIPMLQCA